MTGGNKVKKVKLLIQLGIIILLSLIIIYKVSTDMIKEKSEAKDRLPYSVSINK